MNAVLTVLSLTLVLGAVAVGVAYAIAERRSNGLATVPAELPGWVYFLSPEGGADEEPPAPIKIGMTHRDPAIDRLPEIETMSPRPLEIIHSIKSRVPTLLETAIHAELQPFRRHGEWFDRDAVLAWLDHHYTKGA